MIVAERYGFTVGSVTQIVTADRLDAPAAARLGAAPDSPALVIQRSYFAERTGAMSLVARSICPADRFHIVSRLGAARRAGRGDLVLALPTECQRNRSSAGTRRPQVAVRHGRTTMRRAGGRRHLTPS